MRFLRNDWRNLFNHQKQVGSLGFFFFFRVLFCCVYREHYHSFFPCFQVYTQLAEDDKIRYKNEMKSWEEHMVDIGREDVVRERTLSAQRKTAAAKTKPKVKKTVVKAKAKPVKKAAAKSKTTKKTKKSTTAKIRTIKKK